MKAESAAPVKFKTQEPFGHSRNIVRVVDERGTVVGELHKTRSKWGTPTTYQFYAGEEASNLKAANSTKISTILRELGETQR